MEDYSSECNSLSMSLFIYTGLSSGILTAEHYYDGFFSFFIGSSSSKLFKWSFNGFIYLSNLFIAICFFLLFFFIFLHFSFVFLLFLDLLSNSFMCVYRFCIYVSASSIELCKPLYVIFLKVS